MSGGTRLFLLFAIGWASSIQVIDAQKIETRNALKLSLADYMEYGSPGILIGFERALSRQYSLQAEGGYCGYFSRNREDYELGFEGFKTRLELRWYFEDYAENSYIGWQFMFKKTRQKLLDTFCRDNCNYFQELEYQLQNTVFALHFGGGGKVFIGQRFFVDAGAYAGVRHYHREPKQVPEDATLVEDFGEFRLWQFGKHWIPSVNIALKIGVAW